MEFRVPDSDTLGYSGIASRNTKCHILHSQTPAIFTNETKHICQVISRASSTTGDIICLVAPIRKFYGNTESHSVHATLHSILADMDRANPMWPGYSPGPKERTPSPRSRPPSLNYAGLMERPRRESGYIPYQNALYYRDRDDSDRWRASHTRSSRSVGKERGMSSSRSRSRSDDGRSHHDRARRHGHSRTHSRSRSRSHGPSRSRSRPRYSPQDDPDRPKDKYTLKKAAKCAALGAALEAFRARNEPGPWMGRKGKRMALAAASGVAVGSVRQGSMSAAGWLPYAEALCTGFFAVEWYKKIGRDTHHEENALKEQEHLRVNDLKDLIQVQSCDRLIPGSSPSIEGRLESPVELRSGRKARLYTASLPGVASALHQRRFSPPGMRVLGLGNSSMLAWHSLKLHKLSVERGKGGQQCAKSPKSVHWAHRQLRN
ncbi:uncharacterized protein MYCFIDRAFT_175788 [Pseudocercospora fijiensis CIRAD86]|uniref:Uncharacterized protein n=1 Tax=Pseudocercospora fijiensis (strain CIRAD86) TaxID=383855 RepID=M3AYM0_PSEFD|nr:uncharacterized protein MYCFIDRAFT_175788 [Pseudocercospora fijiensis CIRAD86]EME82248.1 hypothetical protein MYCFIDRAFT_175788 [Pseudocercospora fijiensis CIRAD86]